MENNDMKLMEQLRKLEWLLRRQHMASHMKHGPMGDPHRGQGRVLALLKMQPEISQKDLGYLLDMRPQSLGELLTKLEKSGYIERTPSEADRRVMEIWLTGEGKRVAGEAPERADAGGLFGCLTEEEQETLNRYLARVIGSLEAQLGPEDERDGRGLQGRDGRRPFEDGFGGPHGVGPDGEGPHCGRGRGFGGPGRGDPRFGRGFGPDGMRRDGSFMPLGGERRTACPMRQGGECPMREGGECPVRPNGCGFGRGPRTEEA